MTENAVNRRCAFWGLFILWAILSVVSVVGMLFLFVKYDKGNIHPSFFLILSLILSFGFLIFLTVVLFEIYKLEIGKIEREEEFKNKIAWEEKMKELYNDEEKGEKIKGQKTEGLGGGNFKEDDLKLFYLLSLASRGERDKLKDFCENIDNIRSSYVKLKEMINDFSKPQ